MPPRVPFAVPFFTGQRPSLPRCGRADSQVSLSPGHALGGRRLSLRGRLQAMTGWYGRPVPESPCGSTRGLCCNPEIASHSTRSLLGSLNRVQCQSQRALFPPWIRFSDRMLTYDVCVRPCVQSPAMKITSRKHKTQPKKKTAFFKIFFRVWKIPLLLKLKTHIHFLGNSLWDSNIPGRKCH